MEHSTNTCSNLEDTPVITFYKVLDSGDYSLLGPNGTEAIWFSIYDSYYKEMGLKMPDFKTVQKIQNMSIRYQYIGLLLLVLESNDSNFEDCKLALKKLGYKYNNNKVLQDNLDVFYRSHSVLLTKIEITSKELPEDTDKEIKHDVWAEAVQLRKHYKQSIDPKTIMCIEWIKLKKQLEQDVATSRLTNHRKSSKRT